MYLNFSNSALNLVISEIYYYFREAQGDVDLLAPCTSDVSESEALGVDLSCGSESEDSGITKLCDSNPALTER